MRAALPSRVSTHDQHTLAMQMDVLRACATERPWTVTLAGAGIASGATAKDAAPMRALAPQGFRHAARARSVGLWRPFVRRVLGQQEGMCKKRRPVTHIPHPFLHFWRHFRRVPSRGRTGSYVGAL